MGVLVPSTRRKVTTVVAGKRIAGLETVAVITEGTLLSVEDGFEGGSRVDGSQCVKATVQIEPGRVIHVVGYGTDQIKAIRDLEATGDNAEFNAFLRPSNRNWYKLAELVPTDAPTEQTAA
jgi:hypothetical protein